MAFTLLTSTTHSYAPNYTNDSQIPFSDGKFIHTYVYNNYLYAQVLSYTDTAITKNTAVSVFQTYYASGNWKYYRSITEIYKKSDTTFGIISYEYSTEYDILRNSGFYEYVGTVSGNSISFGSPTNVSGYGIQDTNLNGSTVLRHSFEAYYVSGYSNFSIRWAFTNGTNTYSYNKDPYSGMPSYYARGIYTLLDGTDTPKAIILYIGGPSGGWRACATPLASSAFTGDIQLNSNTNFSNYATAVQIATDKLLVVYPDTTLKAFILTLNSNGTITKSSESNSSITANSTTINMSKKTVAYDTSTAMVFYNPTSTSLSQVTITVDGTTITWADNTSIDSSVTSGNYYTPIYNADDSRLMLFYKPSAGTNSIKLYSLSSSTTHDLDCDITSSATNTFDLDRFKELDADISTSVSASASLDVQSTSMSVAISGSASSSMALDRVKELSCGINASADASADLYKAIGLKLEMQGKATSISELLYLSINIDFKNRFNFSTTASYQIKVNRIDDTNFFVTWIESDFLYYCKGTVSGNDILYSNKTLLVESAVNNYDILFYDYVSNVDFIVAYSRGVNHQGYARTGHISMDGSYSVTLNTEYLVESNYYISSLSITQLVGTNRFLIAYRDGYDSGYGKNKIITNTSNVLSVGDEYIFKSENIESCEIKALSSSSAIICLNNSRFIVASVDVSTITYGIEYAIDMDVIWTNRMCVLDSSTVVCAYGGENDSAVNTFILTISISDTEISFNQAVQLSDHYVVYDLIHLNLNRFVVTYATIEGKQSSVFNVNNLEITVEPSSIFLMTRIEETAASCALDSSTIIVSYNDATSEEYYGWSRVGIITQLPIKILNANFNAQGIVSPNTSYIPYLRLNSNPSVILNISGGMEKNLSTSISAAAESGYELYRALGLSTQLEARAYMTPYLQRARELQLAMEAVSSATAGLDAIKALQVFIEQVSSTTAYGQIERDFELAMDAVSEIAARAEVDIGLRTDIFSTSSVSLSIMRLCDLVDAMAANGTVTSGLSLEIILSSVFNPHSELWAKAYIELSGSCVIEEHADFALTMEHVATLVSLIQGSSSAEANPELTHLLASFVDAKANVFASFHTIIEAMLAIDQTSSMTAEGMIFHGIELICSLDAEASAFFTVDRIAELSAQIDSSATMVSVLQNLLRAYLEFKGSIDKEIALSGILANKIIYTGKLGDKIIYFNGAIL